MKKTTKKSNEKVPLNSLSKAAKSEPNPKTVGKGPHTLVKPLDVDSSVTKPKNMTKKNKQSKPNPLMITGISLVIILAGTVTGFGLSKVTAGNNGGNKKPAEISGIETGTGQITDDQISKGDIFGNEEKPGDEAEGVLEKGGINGEGSHKLLRPGGPSQTVYLTSSVVNLDQLVGHEVKVWGDTFAAQSAGWLMDVVTVEVVNLDAEKPFETE